MSATPRERRAVATAARRLRDAVARPDARKEQVSADAVLDTVIGWRAYRRLERLSRERHAAIQQARSAACPECGGGMIPVRQTRRTKWGPVPYTAYRRCQACKVGWYEAFVATVQAEPALADEYGQEQRRWARLAQAVFLAVEQMEAA